MVIIRKKSTLAQGHIEIILSMTLFVGFLIFLFIFLNPAFKTKEELPIKNVQDKLIENMSSQIGKLSVITAVDNGCYNLDDVNDNYGTNFIEIHDEENTRRYTIYYGDFFDSSLIGTITCLNNPGSQGTQTTPNSQDFSLGAYTEESIVVYEKIQVLKSEYENDYSRLKESLNVRDFAFSIKKLDMEIINELSVEKDIPIGVDVASKDIPIRVINSRGYINEYILNLRVW
ncbi:MAG: hypothetical protein AABX77_02140 [Nanoarchaeota archaeon]